MDRGPWHYKKTGSEFAFVGADALGGPQTGYLVETKTATKAGSRDLLLMQNNERVSGSRWVRAAVGVGPYEVIAATEPGAETVPSNEATKPVFEKQIPAVTI